MESNFEKITDPANVSEHKAHPTDSNNISTESTANTKTVDEAPATSDKNEIIQGQTPVVSNTDADTTPKVIQENPDNNDQASGNLDNSVSLQNDLGVSEPEAKEIEKSAQQPISTAIDLEEKTLPLEDTNKNHSLNDSAAGQNLNSTQIHDTDISQQDDNTTTISNQEKTEPLENNPDLESADNHSTLNEASTPNGSKKRSASGKVKSESDNSNSAERNKSEDIQIGENQKIVLLKIVNSTRQHKDAGPFLEPVDPILLEIPDYPDIVKHPMDLSTAKAKLENNEYNLLSEFTVDIHRVFENCFLYNGKDSPISLMAKQLKKYFSNLMNKHHNSLINAEHVPPSQSSQSMSLEKQMNLCNQLLKELFKKQYYDIAVYFYEPVDHVALNIPEYPKTIKHPMDFGTIRNKLANNEYATSTDFYDDVKMVFDNCYKFNHKKNPVHMAGKELEAIFDSKWAEAFGGSDIQQDKTTKKRRQSSNHTSNPDDADSSIKGSSGDIENSSKGKRDATGSKSINTGSSSKKQSNKPSNSTDPQVEGDLSLHEKQQLSTVIETLPPERLMVAFNIIQSGYPVVIEQKEEIELDIDVLDFKTLRRLYEYVVLDKESD
ncbi:hypothetical protein BB561_006019 [Smittium simulii]|uniref:Bromo domain-containing protein n=1 Tax=Smittium simulii TaxID=133385 RepID=A0A2T9Y706_9FUNG|nr:hypothetical protein BB561_006019 [Smittium simulii]